MIPKIKKILYTTDLSDNSTYVFRYALNSAQMHGAKMDMLHVLKPITGTFPGEGLWVVPQKKEDVLKKIRKRLNDLVNHEFKDDPAKMKKYISSIEVVEGDPVIEILRKADETKPDILIMGTHGKGIVSQTFLGSVVASVLQHTRIPVFVIPLPKT